MVNCLPEECIREILLRLSDSKDLECAGRACLTMNTIAREKRVWRELVQTHFNKQQVEYILENRPVLRENRDWKQLYQSLKRRFGLREDFTEVVMLCRKCSALYWQSLGHPCFIPIDQLTEETSGRNWNFNHITEEQQQESEWCIPLTPLAFLSFFSV
jgi:F-box protein 25/32